VSAGARVSRWRFGDDGAALARALAEGAIVAFPTESSYGLGVRPADAAGVAAIFALKGRAAEKALPVVAADLAALGELGVELDSEPVRWAAARWPAPLTVVVPLRAPLAASGGRPELAVRIPDRADLRELLSLLGGALTATSANRSGAAPELAPEAVAAWLRDSGARAVVVGEGPAPGGPPSTLVAFADGRPRVLRQGRVVIS
jgi:L-threonylcarbamoyladenylate synthase